MQSDMDLTKLCQSLQWLALKLPGSFAYCRLYQKQTKRTGEFKCGITCFSLSDAISKDKNKYLKEDAMFMIYLDVENKRIGLIDPEWKNKEGNPNKPFYYIKLLEQLLP